MFSYIEFSVFQQQFPEVIYEQVRYNKDYNNVLMVNQNDNYYPNSLKYNNVQYKES